MKTNIEYFKTFYEIYELSDAIYEGQNENGNSVFRCTVSKVIHTREGSSDYKYTKPHKVGDVFSLDEYWIEGLYRL